MDYFADFITINPGCLSKVCEILTDIFHRGPTEGERGQKRWRIVKKDVNWYSDANHKPMVAIYTYDYEIERIRRYLKQEGLVA